MPDDVTAAAPDGRWRRTPSLVRDWVLTASSPPGFAETVNIQAYKLGYMGRSERLNPSRIIPIGPTFDLNGPHDRDGFPISPESP